MEYLKEVERLEGSNETRENIILRYKMSFWWYRMGVVSTEYYLGQTN